MVMFCRPPSYLHFNPVGCASLCFYMFLKLSLTANVLMLHDNLRMFVFGTQGRNSPKEEVVLPLSVLVRCPTAGWWI
ncbi:hypothetical protein DFH27DRAFT_570322 [Peziza echinospora]|nr:hypothetical protein DFH27DRAFT_570322 [Peziza echinospora]